MVQYTRQQVLERLKATLDKGEIIVAGGAGTGISAKFQERAGVDLLIVFNSGRYRMDGHGSLSGLLAFGNANEIALEMGRRQVLPVVREIPVICGVNGVDPTKVMRTHLREVVDSGFSGINNFPTVGLIDGNFRASLESSNLGYGKEVEMVAIAHDMEIFSMVYVFNKDEATAMAKAGADVIIAHLGLTAGGSIGATETVGLEEAAERTEEIAAAARKANPDVFVLVHGGPVARPQDVEYVLAKTSVVGFVGASSMERLPVEQSITDAAAAFKRIKRR